MKKLLDLLNEMLEEQGKDYRFISVVDCDFFQIDWKNWLWYETILSKKFWFIKRLVEKDKIDRNNQALQYAKSDLSKFFTEWKDKNWMSDNCAMLLMLLSIQDNPIEFLVFILK